MRFDTRMGIVPSNVSHLGEEASTKPKFTVVNLPQTNKSIFGVATPNEENNRKCK